MDIKVFGEKIKDKTYIKRPAVYGLMLNPSKEKIALIRTEDGKYFLPGGGIENNETHEECLKREALEEMGMEVRMGAFLGCAQRYFYSTSEFDYYLSIGYFYMCMEEKTIGDPTEEGHSLQWVEPSKAIEVLFHEHQSWAVKEALKI